MFTARNRQSPFAKRRQAQREAEAEAKRAAAVPFDRNPEAEEYEQAPDISTYATGGIVERPPGNPGPRGAERMWEPTAQELPAEIDEDAPTPSLPDAEDAEREAPAVVEISADTQAKIDAVMNRAIPPVEETPKYAETVTTGPEGGTIGLGGDTVPVVAPEQVDEPKRGRGRPRPQETIDRDNAVHALLAAADESGVSKEALAVALDEKEQQVYSSLRQLSKEKRAETRYIKGHGYRWFAV